MSDDYIFEKYKRALQSPRASMPNYESFTQEQKDIFAHLRHRALIALITETSSIRQEDVKLEAVVSPELKENLEQIT
jgi:hypothetical protein